MEGKGAPGRNHSDVPPDRTQDGPFSSTQRKSSRVSSKILTAVLPARHLFQTLDNVVFLDFCLSSTRKKESMKRRTGSWRAWCNFTVVPTTLEDYCSNSQEVSPSSPSPQARWYSGCPSFSRTE